MTLRIARWCNGQWFMNPFDLNFEQIKPLLSNESYYYDEFEVRYHTKFLWGWITEIQAFNRVFQEVTIHYGCPSGYTRWKQIEWLKKHDYPFEVI